MHRASIRSLTAAVLLAAASRASCGTDAPGPLRQAEVDALVAALYDDLWLSGTNAALVPPAREVAWTGDSISGRATVLSDLALSPLQTETGTLRSKLVLGYADSLPGVAGTIAPSARELTWTGDAFSQQAMVLSDLALSRLEADTGTLKSNVFLACADSPPGFAASLLALAHPQASAGVATVLLADLRAPEPYVPPAGAVTGSLDLVLAALPTANPSPRMLALNAPAGTGPDDRPSVLAITNAPPAISQGRLDPVSVALDDTTLASRLDVGTVAKLARDLADLEQKAASAIPTPEAMARLASRLSPGILELGYSNAWGNGSEYVDLLIVSNVMDAARSGLLNPRNPELRGSLIWYVESYPYTPEAYRIFQFLVSNAPGNTDERKLAALGGWAQKFEKGRARQVVTYYTAYHLFRIKDYEKSIAWADEYMKGFADDHDRLYLLKALCHVQRGWNAEALVAVRKVKDEFPDSPLIPEALFLEGWALLQTGKPAEARVVLQGLAAKHATSVSADKAREILRDMERRP